MMQSMERSQSGRPRPLLYQAAANEKPNIERIEPFLREVIPDHWRSAAKLAKEIAASAQYLTWEESAYRLDAAIWEQARMMLSNDQITAIINRLNHSHGHCYAVVDYSSFVRASVTAITMQLGEAPIIANAHHALTLALSSSLPDQAAANGWIELNSADGALVPSLAKLPGYSFAMMAIYDNDTAASFMARDAFWRAMLGG